jgi:hypothetical protein
MHVAHWVAFKLRSGRRIVIALLGLEPKSPAGEPHGLVVISLAGLGSGR